MATHFFWDPVEDNIVQERDDSGQVTAEYATEPYLYGNLISQNRGGVESQYHFDSQGSTLALTDDNQQVTGTYAYTAFGEVTEHTGSTINVFQYIGRKGYYRDSETGEYLARARTFSPRLARWLTKDPLHVQMATLSRRERPSISGHLYTYAGNLPTRFVDPSGLICSCEETTKDDCDGKYKTVNVCIVSFPEAALSAKDVRLDEVNKLWKQCCIKLSAIEFGIDKEKAKKLGDLIFDHEAEDEVVKDLIKLELKNRKVKCIPILLFKGVKGFLPDFFNTGEWISWDRNSFGLLVPVPNELLKGETVPTTIAHEIGHALGLHHCDVDADDKPLDKPCTKDRLMHSRGSSGENDEPCGKLVPDECKIAQEVASRYVA